jgi:metal-sulfur cluster biosynthetic enzyme
VTHQSSEVRELLRAVPYPGFSRDIVTAGFVKDITADDNGVVVHFTPNSNNADKVRQMEDGIRDALQRAEIANFKIATSLPFGEDDLALRKPIEAEDDSDFDIDRQITGEGTINPLQAELMQDGIEAGPDMLRDDLAKGSEGEGIGFGANQPSPFEGPAGPPGDRYEGALPVFQWDIDPHDPSADSVETGVRLDDWEIRVWWQAHPTEDLLYASLQAMRDDWADHVGTARQHPVGRSAAVNLVFDRRRGAVLAIYGTVRDFRPFVEAFRQAYAEQGTAMAESDSQESES